MRLPLSLFKVMIIIVHIFSTVSSLNAQDNNEITIDWIYSDASRELTAVAKYFWLKDNTAILFNLREAAEQRVFEKYNPTNDTKSKAIDLQKALASINTFSAIEQMQTSLKWPLAFDAQGKQAIYLFYNDIYLLNLAKSKFQQITNTTEEEKVVHFSPDGQKISFVRKNDLYLYNIQEKKETRLTKDGSETILNGTPSWVYWEEIFGRNNTAYWWSDDSKSIAYLRSDDSEVSITHFVDFKPNVPALIKQRYPKAGTPNPQVKVGIIDIENAQTTWVDLAEEDYEYIPRLKWHPDSKWLSVQTLNRSQDELKLYFVNPKNGRARLILQETDQAWVNIQDDLTFLNDEEHFLWQSERDGYAHLYKFKIDGSLVNQVTKGNWAVKSAGRNPRKTIAAIDEVNDWIYFSSLEKSPTERHLYRIHSNGTGMERLSAEDGIHSVQFSPDSKYFFDLFSNVQTLPSLALYKNNGSLLQTVSKPRTELAQALDFQYPELFNIPASDGFMMPAEILKPKSFDPRKKYPVIMNIYGGPSAPTVSNMWNRGHYFDQILVKKGYLVVRFDHRAAAGVSKKFENMILKQFIGPIELADILDGIKWLKSQPWMDEKRFGMWGWSGGGTFTLFSMTNSKEIKAGIAVAPMTDWHYYDSKWAEFAMKTPQENPDGYKKTSLIPDARNLDGRLLLVTGTYDDNVHPQNSWSFVEELVQANKPFDMMFYPMRKHSISDRPARIHLFNKMLAFWEEKL